MPGGFLGIHAFFLTPADAQAIGIDVTRGYYVSAVFPHTPADREGLRGAFESVEDAAEEPCCPPGGDVIVAVDGVVISTPEGDELVSPWAHLRAGDTITLTVLREGRMFDVDVILGEFPPE